MSTQRYEPVHAGNAPGAAGDETSGLHVLDTTCRDMMQSVVGKSKISEPVRGPLRFFAKWHAQCCPAVLAI